MILGIDTSCYTTSVAVVSLSGELVGEARIPVPVDIGKQGVAQSQALFRHVRQLPCCLEELFTGFSGDILGVCASVKPRPAEESYMPVFCAGESAGRNVAAVLGVPFYKTTHQESHLAAAVWSSGDGDIPDDFLAVHLSGGTTELLRISRLTVGFDINLLGGSDLAAGQMIDRIGVAMGLPFPAGPFLETLAADYDSGIKLPVSVSGMNISFSGPESQAQRLLKRGADKSGLAAAVLDNIALSIVKAAKNAAKQTGLRKLLLMGGVMANMRIRNVISGISGEGIEVFFAKPAFSGDNAVGTALLGLAQHVKK